MVGCEVGGRGGGGGGGGGEGEAAVLRPYQLPAHQDPLSDLSSNPAVDAPRFTVIWGPVSPDIYPKYVVKRCVVLAA